MSAHTTGVASYMHWATCFSSTSQQNLFCSASLWSYTKYDSNLLCEIASEFCLPVIKILVPFYWKNWKGVLDISIWWCMSKPYFMLLYVWQVFSTLFCGKSWRHHCCMYKCAYHLPHHLYWQNMTCIGRIWFIPAEYDFRWQLDPVVYNFLVWKWTMANKLYKPAEHNYTYTIISSSYLFAIPELNTKYTEIKQVCQSNKTVAWIVIIIIRGNNTFW